MRSGEEIGSRLAREKRPMTGEESRGFLGLASSLDDFSTRRVYSLFRGGYDITLFTLKVCSEGDVRYKGPPGGEDLQTAVEGGAARRRSRL